MLGVHVEISTYRYFVKSIMQKSLFWTLCGLGKNTTHKVVYFGRRLGYYPHIFSTTAESFAKTNENAAQQNAYKEKEPCFFCKCVLSPVGEKQRTMADAVHFCGTLNTDVITGLDMCKVCTEAVHGVALWTRTLSRAWTRVKYIPKQSFLESKICCFLLFISGNSSFVLNQND